MLKESRYKINEINNSMINIKNQINVIKDSTEADILVNRVDHGFNVQPIKLGLDGEINIADSATGLFANALIIPIDKDNFIIKTSGKFKVPITFQDIYGGGISVNVSYYLKGTKLTSANPLQGKVQNIFDTFIYDNTVYAVLTLNNPIIEYVVDF